VFDNIFNIAEDESQFSQTLPGVAYVANSSNFEELQDDINLLESTKANKIPPRITLPSIIYSVVGTQLNLYYDAITLGYGVFNVEVLTDIGNTHERMYQVTPTINQIGDHTLTVNVYDFAKVLLETKTAILRVITNSIPTSVKNILLLGDSTLNNGPVTATVRGNFTAMGSNTPIFRGGKGISPNNHQG
jgi:hypothetical protein